MAMRSSRVRSRASALDPRTTMPAKPVDLRYVKYFFCACRSRRPVFESKNVTAGTQIPGGGTVGAIAYNVWMFDMISVVVVQWQSMVGVVPRGTCCSGPPGVRCISMDNVSENCLSSDLLGTYSNLQGVQSLGEDCIEVMSGACHSGFLSELAQLAFSSRP